MAHDAPQAAPAEAALLESEKRYRTLFDTIDEGFCIIEFFDGPHGPLSDYVHIEANPAYTRHAGIPDVVGKTVRELVPHEADGWVALCRDVLVTGRPIRFDRELVATGRHLELSAFRVEPASRRQVAVLFQDVTARRRAETALRASDERLRMALTAARMVSWQWDRALDRGVLSGNSAAVYGLPEGTTLTSSTEWERLVHPDDLEAYRATTANIVANGGRYVTHLRLVRPDTGAVVWLEQRGQAVTDDQGIVTQIVGLDLDITERKEAEAVRAESERRAEEALRESEHRLRQMADTMAHMIWVTRPDGYHEWFNRRWYEFTGVPMGSTDGEGWNDVFHPDDQARAWAQWRHSLETGEFYQIEYRLRHHSGEYRWVQGRALPIRDAHGAIERWFGTCTDIHELRLLSDERGQLLESEQAARVEAERASRMKDEFLATLSHEIRTPLNAILGWATLLRSGRLQEGSAAQGLEIIERNARVQAKMIEDLLDMSRIISGKLRLDVQRVELAEVIRAAAETVTPAASAKSIRLHLVLDPLASPISGDPNRMQQVFWNLLSNAIKFTPKGGRVQVLLERIDSHVEVSVIDSGEGIAPDFLPHVFDRFRQEDATRTRPHGGLGLGLAIVKQVVELHGGTIRATSPGRGHGATFVVSLPLTVLHQGVTPHTMRRHPTSEPATWDAGRAVDIRGVRLLVVDDEPDARALLRRLFEEQGAIVDTAATPNEALERLENAPPDVLVSDIGMPGEDGYSLIRRVRALPAERGGRTPAIALTAYAGAEDRVRALVAGFQHHLAKPIEPVELIVLVASLMTAR